MDGTPHIPITVHLQTSLVPAVFDLSGAFPFEITLESRRFEKKGDDPRPLTLWTDESIFDIPDAFAHGFFELIDLESGSKVDIDIPLTAPRSGLALLITLPSRASEEYPDNPFDEHIVHLDVAKHLQRFVRAGRTYRLRIQSHNLGVKWWTYGYQKYFPHGVPPSSPGDLVAVKPAWTDFLTVSSLPIPPAVTVSLSARLFDLVQGSQEFSPCTIRLEVTNRGTQPISVKSNGDQPYISCWDPHNPGGPSNRDRITSTSTTLSVQSFKLCKAGSKEDFMHNGNSSVGTMAVGSNGEWSRNQFTTLDPGIPLVQKMPFTPFSSTIKERIREHKMLVLTLRSEDVWWCFGTIDELFGDDKTVLKKCQQQPTVPLTLASDDRIILLLEAKKP